jgi:citrate lyase subunit beta / citryl-CoA lyase
MHPSIADLGPALLFCPGDRPERFLKAAEASDQAVLDLEDGTAPANRETARGAIAAFLRDSGVPAIVRINSPQTAQGLADADAVMAAGARILLLPKTEGAAEIDAVAALGDAALVALIESAKGVEAMSAIADHPRVAALSWGPYDLAGDMGMRQVRDGANALLSPLAAVRDRLIVAAAAARKPLIDTVTAEIKNLDLLAREAAEAAAFGFHGKMCIHPSQVPVIRAAFRPSEAEVERARRMLAASEGRGAFAFEGEMVDEPILKRARRIVAAAERAAA